MLPKELFLEKYNIDPIAFSETGLDWEDLIKIYENHTRQTEELFDAAQVVARKFQRLETVNSVKIRVKNPEHLIHKIIRKVIKDKERKINLDTYETETTDLIGIRLLHIFKQEWEEIHNSIIENFTLHEKPKAYVRDGDIIQKIHEEKDCIVEIHKFGYRSIHYLIKSSPYKKEIIIELQVRTIFEEGWSEVDHKINYPLSAKSNEITGILSILNRISGVSDEISSFAFVLDGQLKNLLGELHKSQEINAKLENENSEKQSKENEFLDSLKLKDEEKKSLDILISKLRDKISKLEASQFRFPTELRNNPLLAGAYGALLGATASTNPDYMKFFEESRRINSNLLSLGQQTCPSCGQQQFISSVGSANCEKCGRPMRKSSSPAVRSTS